MKREEVAEWLEFMQEEEHNKADSIFPCTNEIALGIAIEALKQLQIVRCKDCRHFREARYEDEGEPPYIKQKCGLFKYQVVPDGFCYQGEWKDGDGE